MIIITQNGEVVEIDTLNLKIRNDVFKALNQIEEYEIKQTGEPYPLGTYHSREKAEEVIKQIAIKKTFVDQAKNNKCVFKAEDLIFTMPPIEEEKTND